MSFVVLYDANVLYPSTLRDLLIRVAQAGLVQAKWTDQILDEGFGNLATNRPDLDPQRLTRTRELMNRAVRDCLVTGYEPLVDALDLPDPDDRHVLAAAIKARAQVIVTHNRKDFPSSVLEEWDMEAKSADDFILDQIDLSHDSVYGAVQRIADSRRNPPATFLLVAVVLGFTLAGQHPYLGMGISLYGLGVLGIVALQTAASASIVGFFLRHRKDESVWGSIDAPALGGIGLLAGLILMIINYPTLTGSNLTWVTAMPLALPVAALAGAIMAGRQGSAQADEDHAAKPVDTLVS